jgi:hypothetical protein
MATIFLSYRRTDSPQACRVCDWLVRRFGEDAVFMDVSAIPFAVDFPGFIKDAIDSSKVLIALIGSEWLAKIDEPDDPVRTEIEAAVSSGVPVLPVLIGNTSMPDPEELPSSISTLAAQNAFVVGVSRDFDTHMRLLQPRIESILGTLARESAAAFDSDVITRACEGIARYLRDAYCQDSYLVDHFPSDWKVVGAGELNADKLQDCVTLFLHRVVRLAEFLELHFILSFWGRSATADHMRAGWVMRELAGTPLLPDQLFADTAVPAWRVKIRRSDEDARQVWKMITGEPPRLSLTYIATVSPKGA